MDQLINAIVAMMRRDPRTPPAPRKFDEDIDLESAPTCVRELADALSTSMYFVQLGAFFLCRNNFKILGLDVAFDAALDNDFEDLEGYLKTAGPDGGPFDAANSLLIERDPAGMSALGAYWSGGDVHFVIVEMADPTEDNLLTWLSSPEAFLTEMEQRRRGVEAPELDELRAMLAVVDD